MSHVPTLLGGGNVPLSDLRVGDTVVTAAGSGTVRWIDEAKRTLVLEDRLGRQRLEERPAGSFVWRSAPPT